MFVKIGTRILNTDQISAIELTDDTIKIAVNNPAPSSSSGLMIDRVLLFRGEDAELARKALAGAHINGLRECLER